MTVLSVRVVRFCPYCFEKDHLVPIGGVLVKSDEKGSVGEII